MGFIPNHERKLAAQTMQTLRADVSIQMQSDFAIRPGAKAMTGFLQLARNGLVAVKLAIHDDSGAIISACDRLIAGYKIDDAQARVT
jgi:hypothetical protein